ncbi:MAG: hypothetical protein A2268_14400 [Candidatus Raymondbacteria bacterium RifOxyA12_full_50_37]|uniref:Sialate O-acetylesterase domain-containing protein n=1 Tax=Candidatus Raymondbacteria bacterium RIFOXYD12_FULL_49_13 TaxID=1817890 RepID=A0A1F7F908_UNCRA|nr:MAG: hypothetical protein A2268_14400 [Candidatus Raymondbacteria bacterium RifOxyA12_full_50_37]OGJ88611.1 MAG: hypothetical protein A2248_20335 [Candidatus Raymondbacteria bacterium RIFOXYA2_FULL_49_16]OGK03150.1 MAG: hypothetical protein A2519_07030 [Candidatus Raymondbacteria bacterium RIFOXYD12_FULL_49_13]OGK06453.1 MAG: hypothetical protein A2487_12015 [Candidatus Raymondbacteria bacterium RifOxyC12_full_50_8]OGP41647.1 MAG: hypothetical protein A2324_07420 [Candidatus Raymondbacteria 
MPIFVLLFSVLIWPQNVNFTIQPKPYQFFARDALDSALVTVAGSVPSAGYDSISATVLKNGVFWKRAAIELPYDNGSAPFTISIKLHAELSEYRVSIALDSTVIVISDSVVCGDAFLAEGQSNTITRASWDYKSQWIRSYGTGATDGPTCAADSQWGLAQAGTQNSHCAIGVWAMQMSKSIVDTYHVPVFFLNGGVGGTAIVSHLRNNANKGDLTTIYGRFYSRIIKSGLSGHVKALFWYQGESHTTPTCYNYTSDWGNLRTCWKEDFPGLNAFYVVQLHHSTFSSCAGPRQDFIREAQRALPSHYPDVKVISTMGLSGNDGCHYNVTGYQELGVNIFRIVARDYYNSTDTIAITPPGIQQIYYLNTERTEIALVFDQPVVWPDDSGGLSLRNYFYFDTIRTGVEDTGKSDMVDSGKTGGENSILLYLKAPSSARMLTYLPNFTIGAVYKGPYIKNVCNIGALTFMNFPIDSAPSTYVSRRNEWQETSPDISIFPDPSNPSAVVMLHGNRYSPETPADIRIYSADGTLCKAFKAEVLQLLSGCTIDGKNLHSGVYFLHCQIGEKLLVRKMVLAK